MKNKDIFTKNFTGSIDQLLNHTQKNANFVEKVIDGEEDIMLDDDEALDLIKSEYPDLSDIEAVEVLGIIKTEYVKETLDELVKAGFVEISGYNSDGEPLYKTTELGNEAIKAFRPNNNKKKKK